ncbi:hypothetical protein SK128_025621 [Halocaridina rubra]|uniref:TRPM SLOG domain-containing protein n=1 Tax=Halocaridina rubra TaxID=373956 RepID=A0AAN8X0Y9_HALRR
MCSNQAVKSTHAWILTGGCHIGVMKSVGDAVNKGQYIVKERDHMMRGIRCLGIVPWGYIKDRDSLINKDLSDFSHVKYKVSEKCEASEPVSLNGDHTHFLMVDNGTRDKFGGADAFRTRLEEAIQEPEPLGFGMPVVLLLLEGGISSVSKCCMALKSNIPVVVVAGTGRAADLLAYAVSMTVRTQK